MTNGPAHAGRETARTRRDACPGALQVHEAADGGLARVRVPGGRLTPSQLTAIADCAERLGSGVVELTSRANLQVRGLTTRTGPEHDGPSSAEAFAARIAEAGLLPSPTHERVRNIVASPYAGRGPSGHTDVTPLVEALDHALCAEPRLAELPGRFLFAIDDGSGDVAALGADVTWTPSGLLVAGLPVRPGAGTSIEPVTVMVAAALAFLDERRLDARPPLGPERELPRNRRGSARDAAFVEQDGGSSTDTPAWRISELADGPARIAARLGGALAPRNTPTPTPATATPDDLTPPHATPPATPRDTPHAAPPATPHGPPPATPHGARPAAPYGVRRAGVVEQRDGRVALEVLVPLGRLSPGQVRALATTPATTPAPVVLTPWRSVVLLDLSPPAAKAEGQRLAGAGLVTDPGSPWAGVTACTGSPGCAKSLADVQADAAHWVAGRDGVPELPVHWSGCERRCGRPRGEVIDHVATPEGYRRAHPGAERPEP